MHQRMAYYVNFMLSWETDVTIEKTFKAHRKCLESFLLVKQSCMQQKILAFFRSHIFGSFKFKGKSLL